ncbi:MAG: hypothetical protein H7255_20770 [Ramlibacter sp.]|nr:hypothetical protein [Ramlibacter sp.]
MAANIRARYARAVHSGNLTVIGSKNNTDDAETTERDPEILGAYGLADRDLVRGQDAKGRTFKPAPLAVPLERLFAGDGRAAHQIVGILAYMASTEARRLGVKLAPVQAMDMAKATLAWFRNGTCKPCGGRGFPMLKDSPVQSAHACDRCQGSGKIPFEKEFRFEWKPVARWLKEQIELESGRAGPAAMKTLAGRMSL